MTLQTLQYIAATGFICILVSAVLADYFIGRMQKRYVEQIKSMENAHRTHVLAERLRGKDEGYTIGYREGFTAANLAHARADGMETTFVGSKLQPADRSAILSPPCQRTKPSSTG